MKFYRTILAVTFSVTIFIIPQSLYSQNNFIKGFIITNENDTISGFIDYKNWEINPDRISFKKTLADKKSEFYNAMTIKEFDVNNEIYESGEIQIETSPVQTNELSHNAVMDFENRTAFLLAFVRGQKSLYLYKTKKQKEQYYIKNDTTFELLKYKKYLKTNESENVVVLENKKYIGQLMLYLGNYEELIPQIQTAEYNQKSLIKLFNNYYSKNQTTAIYRREADKIKSEFGAFAGITSTTVAFYGWYNQALLYTNYPSSTDFTAGLSYNFVLPRNREKWSIYNELMYSTYKFAGRSVDYLNENQYEIFTSGFGLSYIKINNLLRYNFLLKDLKIFLNAGLSNGFVIAENRNNLITETRFYTSHSVSTTKVLDEIRTYEQGLMWGAGIKYRNLSLEFRLEQANGMSPYVGLHGNIDRYFMLFGYQF